MSTISNSKIKSILDTIAEFEQIKYIRFHIRFPIIIPSRFDTELLQILNTSKKKILIAIHTNHIDEFSKESEAVIKKLSSLNISLLSQSVLLKGVNDSATTLAELSEQLFDSGIQPYYLHLFDKVQGVAHFDIAEAEAKKIATELMAILPGFLMPKLVREIAGEASKTPISLP